MPVRLNMQHCTDANIIFAPRVTDDYPCEFDRIARLREKYGKKVICFPNLYYAVYNRKLFYQRNKARKPLGGPLGVYHNRIFLKPGNWVIQKINLMNIQKRKIHRRINFNP